VAATQIECCVAQMPLGGLKMAIHQFSSILIVDDSSVVRGVVRKLLMQLGYKNIDEAPDGEAALEKISDEYFALVISDWNMGQMSGKVLLEQVRAIKKHASMPFIMMTADPSIDKLLEAKHAGVTCFIKKPFDAQDLQAKILQANRSNRLTVTA
jgi:two-component system chemotaxis response regulator CheY